LNIDLVVPYFVYELVKDLKLPLSEVEDYKEKLLDLKNIRELVDNYLWKA